jgi:hypothetical protein
MIQIDQPSSPLWLPRALRQKGLFGATALAVGAAWQMHMHKVPWHSLGDLLAAWVFGYCVLFVISMGAGVLISMWGPWFLKPTQSTTEPDMGQIVVYVWLTVLAIAVGDLVLYVK